MKASWSRLRLREPLWGLLLLVLSGSLIAGCQLADITFGQRESYVSPVTLSETQGPEMSFIPVALQPPLRDFARMHGLADVIGLIRAGDLSAAAVQLTSEKARFRTSAYIESLHAWVLLQQGEAGIARKMAQNVVDHHEPKTPAAYALAVLHRELGAFREAMPWYQLTLEQHSNNPALLREVALCAYSAGQEAEALSLLDRLAAFDALTSDDLILRARLLVVLRRYEAALLVFERLRHGAASDAGILLEAGQCAYTGGQFGKAITLCREAVQLDPQNAVGHFSLGQASAAFLDPLGAEAAFSRALELKPDYLEAGYALAVLLSNQSLLEEAYHILNQLSRQPLSSLDLEKVQNWINEIEG